MITLKCDHLNMNWEIKWRISPRINTCSPTVPLYVYAWSFVRLFSLSPKCEVFLCSLCFFTVNRRLSDILVNLLLRTDICAAANYVIDSWGNYCKLLNYRLHYNVVFWKYMSLSTNVCYTPMCERRLWRVCTIKLYWYSRMQTLQIY